MTPSSQRSGSDGSPSPTSETPDRDGKRKGKIRRSNDSIGVVIWSTLVVLLALGLFYGWRTLANRDRLVERNLRELDRIGRTIEARVGSFIDLLERHAEEIGPVPDPGEDADTLSTEERNERAAAREDAASLIPDFAADSLLVCHHPRLELDQTLDLCVTVEDSAGLGGPWTLDPIRRALVTDLFDAVFVADRGTVVVMVTAAGGIRMRELPPPDSGSARVPERSTVRSASIAGRDYRVFLQPMQIGSPDRTGSQAATSRRWTVGGLVSTPGFRAESLALGTSHLVFLGLLFLLTLLALPFLRVTLIGPWERVSLRDVYVLVFSMVVMSGLLGLMLGDATYYRRLRAAMDDQLEALGSQMATTFHAEIREALQELQRRNDEFQGSGRRLAAEEFREDTVPTALPSFLTLAAIENHPEEIDSLRSRTRIFRADTTGTGPDSAGIPPDTLPTGRYVAFQMVFWTDPEGMQVAKWTPRNSNTARVSVNDRPYFWKIRERSAWPVGGTLALPDIVHGSPDDSAREQPKDTLHLPYFVQSLRSKTTGENVTALSLPYCWDWTVNWTRWPCAREHRGVSVILAPLASVDQPVLPPGVEFAIIEPDGRTLFHSRPERNLDENLFEETSDNPTLRTLVEARSPGLLNAVYMGRPSRLGVQPIPETPLSLVVVHDDQYLGTVHFQSLSLALAMFVAWALILGMLVLVVEALIPGRLRWLWPDPRYPDKYRLLVRVLGGFVGLLLAQALLAIRLPVHPSSLLVPVQALALGLVILSRGMEPPPQETVPKWRSPAGLGWIALGGATGLQLLSHVSQMRPSWYLLLGLAQIGMVWWAVTQVRRWDLPDPLQASSREAVRNLAVASAALALIVAGVLPALLFYQESFGEYLERLVRHNQVEVVEGLRARAERVRSVNRDGGLPEAYDRLFVDDENAWAFQEFFATKEGDTNEPLDGSRVCRWERGSTLRDSFHPLVEVPTSLATGVAPEMGGLTRKETQGMQWRCSGGLVELSVAGMILQSEIPGRLWLPTNWWPFVAILAFGILFCIPAWVSRRVFLLDLDYAQPASLEDHLSLSDSSLIVVCTRSMNRRSLVEMLRERGIHYVDLLEIMHENPDQNAKALEAETRDHARICLDHFDQRLGDPSWAGPLLARLEELIHVRGRTVLLLTSREPSALFPRSAEIEPGTSGKTRRWVRVLGQLEKVRVTSFRADASGKEKEVLSDDPLRSKLLRVLRYESRSYPALRRITARLERRLDRLKKSGGELPTPEALVDQIREMADSYYHALWSILEREEKLVVGQLAAGAVVNPKCERAVRRLLERRILVLEPELRLMNESFARFVREEIPSNIVAGWERDERVSSWQRLRFPILLGLGTVAAFLFVTQRTTFDAMIAVLSTAAVGTTAAVKILSVARSSDSRS